MWPGSWVVETRRGEVRLLVRPFARLNGTTWDEVAAEAERLVEFLAPGGTAGTIERC